MALNKKYVGIIAIALFLALVIAGYAGKFEKPEEYENEEVYIEDEYEKFLQEKVLPNMIKNNNTGKVCDLNEAGEESAVETVDLGESNIVIQDENFVATIDELHLNLNKYLGRTISYEGFVYKVPEVNPDIYVVGRYIEESHGDHNHETFIGVQGIYEGQWPSDDTWVQVKGIIEKVSFNGQELPAVKIEEINVKPEDGQRKVYN